MEKELNKYIGRAIEIIYMGVGGVISQRLIIVRSINKGVIKAYCFQRKAPCTFKIGNILALHPIVERATA